VVALPAKDFEGPFIFYLFLKTKEASRYIFKLVMVDLHIML